MVSECFNNYFNGLSSTKAALNNKRTCPTKPNICNSNSDGGSSKKSCRFTGISSRKQFSATTTTTATIAVATLGNSTRLCPTALKRKIRKTSRRKRERRRNGCLHNDAVNMVDNIRTTAAVADPPTTTSHKCTISVNNARITNFNSYASKNKKIIYNSRRRYFCKRICCKQSGRGTSGIIRAKNRNSSCGSSHCSNYCNCSCSSKKISLIVKTIVSLLLPQITRRKTATKLAHAATTTTAITSTNRKCFTNNDNRKKVKLQEKFQQLQNVYTLGKCVNNTTIKQQQQQYLTNEKFLENVSTLTTSCTSSSLLPPAATAIVTKQKSASSPTSSFSSYLPVNQCNSSSNNSFSTILTKCKTSTATTNLTNSYSCPTPSVSSSSSSPFATRYSLTCLAPARIFNELYGAIFMTLLVLSICHNNVLQTSAASVKVSSLVAAEQIIMPNNGPAAGRLNERQYKRQHPPEKITQQYHQQLSQADSYHHQPQSYLNEEVVQPLENEMQEDKSNHIFQPQIQPETLPTYEQQERDQQQQQQYQQHLTTQATSFSHGVALETTYNHTFESLSIIDGGLTVAVDANQNLMTIEEEMLVAAAGGAVGVGSNTIGLGNHLQHHNLHTSNNGLGTYNSAAMRLDSIDVMSYNSETNSMPIFDFGMPRNITARTGHTEAVIKCRVDSLDDKSVSWIRKRDLHILTVGTATYTSDKRFQVTESKDSREWTLHVKSPQARDSGIYECQVNTEPKMSMAFQLNVIEISPDAKAVIMGPADLHFKVGSAIILTCIVHQPSVKDIGPIYWYRGEYMITPFDINENTYKEATFTSAGGVTPPPTIQNKANVLEQNYHQDNDALFGGVAIGADTEQIPQILTNEITKDFAQRIAMESQLGDTMKSRLRISNAQTSDTGNYTCQPTTASSASVMVHVINDENPAAMQKSGANSSHCRSMGALLSLVYALMVVATAAATTSLLNILYVVEREGYVGDIGCCGFSC